MADAEIRPRVAQDHFPDETGNIREYLKLGDEKAAMHHVMRAYRSALAVYFNGSSFRWRFNDIESGECAADDFFADRVGRSGFLQSWLNGSSRFRYWLVVSFVNHLRHRLRKERSEQGRLVRLADRTQRVPRDLVRDRFEAELARGLMSEAHALAEQTCNEEGRSEEWRTFVRHYIDGRSYKELMSEQGKSHLQISNQVRHATMRLRQSFRKLLSVQGGDPDRELHHLMEVFERCRH